MLSQREVVRALTGLVKGDLGRYLESQNLKPFLDNNVIASQFAIPANPVTAIGYEATLLLDICDAYLRARDENALASNQLHLAKQAEIITRACAKVGIIALIDAHTKIGHYPLSVTPSYYCVEHLEKLEAGGGVVSQKGLPVFLEISHLRLP